MTEKVYILDTSMIRFYKYPDRTLRELAQQATLPLLKRWKLKPQDIDAVIFANSGWERNSGQTCIRGEVALRGIGIEGMPVINVENACAGGSTAIHVGYLKIKAEESDLVLVVGAEKVFHRNKTLMMTAFLGGMDVEEFPRTLREIEKWIREHGLLDQDFAGNAQKLEARKKNQKTPWIFEFFQNLWALFLMRGIYGKEVFKAILRAGMKGLGGDRTPFMDLYALAARHAMKEYGLTQRHLAIVASKNRWHGSMNPLAQVQKPLSVEEVLADKLVSYPLTRSMCAPIGDGAAALLLSSERFLKKISSVPKVRIRASVLVSGTNRTLEEGEDLAERAARKAYDDAGLGPEDLNIAELHDATAFGEIHHYETMGLCKKSMGGEFAESGATKLGGRIPVNLSGGLECRGHPIAATGIAQIHEVFLQLTGRAGKRQVENARIALTQNGGGFIGFEEAALAVHILERVS